MNIRKNISRPGKNNCCHLDPVADCAGVGVVAGEAAAPHQGEHSLSLTLLLSLLPPARLWYSNIQYLQSISIGFIPLYFILYISLDKSEKAV